jgi:hypothetical protein
MGTLARLIPDIDGLGIIPQILTRNPAHPWLWLRSITTHCTF